MKGIGNPQGLQWGFRAAKYANPPHTYRWSASEGTPMSLVSVLVCGW